MAKHYSTRLLETSAITIGYAMSRLDARYLRARKCTSWRQAFQQAATALDAPPASFKNLRDEFDPVHGNMRRGWHGRPLRKSRQRVLSQLCDVSDAALVELVDRILAKDPDALEDAVAVLATPTRAFANVAERLLTGRRAEEYFLKNCKNIINVVRSSIQDHRNAACGFDFGIRGRERVAVEVKGIKASRGDVLFTDREWTEATSRRDDYWLVVVGNIETSPVARAIRDPVATLDATCRYQTSIAASWRANVAVA